MEQYEVPLLEAQRIAMSILPTYFKPHAKGSWAMENLPTQAQVSPVGGTAIGIYDLRRVLLFWDVIVALKDGQYLRIRTAANRLLGGPILSIGVAMKDLGALVSQARVGAAQSGATGDALLVCYNYPRLGLLVQRDGHPVIRDILDNTEWPLEGFEASGGALSPLDQSAESSASMWRVQASHIDPRAAWTVEEFIAMAESMVLCAEGNGVGRVPAERQRNEAYCAPAAAKLILAYHKMDKTQDEIANAAKTDLNATSTPGTRPEDLAAAFSALSVGAWKGQLGAPELGRIQSETAQGRPLLLVLQGSASLHCQVVASWRTCGGRDELHTWDPLEDPLGGWSWDPWGAHIYSYAIYVDP